MLLLSICIRLALITLKKKSGNIKGSLNCSFHIKRQYKKKRFAGTWILCCCFGFTPIQLLERSGASEWEEMILSS